MAPFKATPILKMRPRKRYGAIASTRLDACIQSLLPSSMLTRSRPKVSITLNRKVHHINIQRRAPSHQSQHSPLLNACPPESPAPAGSQQTQLTRYPHANPGLNHLANHGVQGLLLGPRGVPSHLRKAVGASVSVAAEQGPAICTNVSFMV
jgi:hypothetical protein